MDILLLTVIGIGAMAAATMYEINKICDKMHKEIAEIEKSKWKGVTEREEISDFDDF